MARATDKPKKIKAIQQEETSTAACKSIDFSNKEIFIEHLKKAGYEVIEENGLPVILTNKNLREISKLIQSIVVESNYRSSYGIREA